MRRIDYMGYAMQLASRLYNNKLTHEQYEKYIEKLDEWLITSKTKEEEKVNAKV